MIVTMQFSTLLIFSLLCVIVGMFLGGRPKRTS
jgi:hypothetical protein